MKLNILRLLKKHPMTTDELAKELRAARSTVAQALATLHEQRIVCIAAYRPTGSSPARLWGLGAHDAASPPPQSQLARNARRRERARMERERLSQSTKHEPRCDIAAAWLTNPLQ